MVVGHIWTSRVLLWQMVRRELHSRTVGSLGGWVWLLARPVLTGLAYLFIFDTVFQVRLGDSGGGNQVGVFLLAGLLPWMALTDGVMAGTVSLLESANLLQKTALPLELFPARAVLGAALLYGPVVVLFGLWVMVARGTLDWALVVPLWFGLQVVLTYFLALILAIFAAAFACVICWSFRIFSSGR